jgi:hypothetical protein
VKRGDLDPPANRRRATDPAEGELGKEVLEREVWVVFFEGGNRLNERRDTVTENRIDCGGGGPCALDHIAHRGTCPGELPKLEQQLDRRQMVVWLENCQWIPLVRFS